MGLTNIKQELINQKYLTTKERMDARLRSMGLCPLSDAEAEKQMQLTSLRCDISCPICGGNGYVQKNPEADVHNRGFGAIEMCPNYRARQLRNMDLSQYGMERDELELTWQAVKKNIGYLRLDGTRAVEAVKPKFEQGYGMVALLGTFGQGKTLVGKILIARSLNAGKQAAYANMSRILNDISKAFEDKEHMATELLKRMERWNALDILFIDELDKTNNTPWAMSMMFEVLDRRYVRAVRKEALTVIASNKSDDELDGYLVSRLKDHRLGPVVYLNGDDARQVMTTGWKH